MSRGGSANPGRAHSNPDAEGPLPGPASMGGELLAGLFLLALAVRWSVLAQLWEAPFMHLLLGDARAYDQWSARITGGDWWGSETFYQAPLYPYFLAAVRSLGVDLPGARILQGLLAALGCCLVAQATARLFTRRTGLVAGVLAALYAPLIWVDGMIQKTSLGWFLCAVLLGLLAHATSETLGERKNGSSTTAASARDRDGPHPIRTRTAFAIGVVLALSSLVRENSLLLIVPLAVWLGASLPRRAALLPLALGLALVFLPVGIRNFALGGSFLPTASNAGVNFYLGNRTGADGLYTPLIRGRGHPAYEEQDARRLAQVAEGRELTPAEVSAHWLRRGLDDVKEAPGRWLVLLGWKAQLLLHRDEPMDAESFESHRAESSLLNRLAHLFHAGLLLPFAAMGWFLTRGRRGFGLIRAAGPVLAAGLLLFFVVGRFRLGLLPFCLPFAAHGVVVLARAIRHRRSEPRLRSGVLLALLLGLVSNLPLDVWPLRLWPFEQLGDPIATTDSNLASEAMRQGDAEAARDFAARSLERDPTSAAAHFNLGVATRALGDLERAREAFTRAAQLEPSYRAAVLASLGTLDAMAGDMQGALVQIESACRLDAGDALCQYDRGLVLSQLGRRREAEDAYRIALGIAPDFVDAHHNLAFVLEAQGRWEEALASYAAALELDPTFRLTHEALDRVLREHPGAQDPRR